MRPEIPRASKVLLVTDPPVVPSLMSMCSAVALGPKWLFRAWLRSLRSGPEPSFSPYLDQLLCAEPRYSPSPNPGWLRPVSCTAAFCSTLSELDVRKCTPSSPMPYTWTLSMRLRLDPSSTMLFAALVTAKPVNRQYETRLRCRPYPQ